MIYTGLPFPCVGPVHGTAYDIAGKAKANSISFQEAMEMISKMLDTHV